MTHVNRISLCLPYYLNPGMLRAHYDLIKKLPAEILEAIELVVVDDGSPSSPAWHEVVGCPVSIYRITVDVRWNQDAARNLGVAQAAHPWVLLTDIDHLVPEATWSRIVFGKLSWKTIYRFSRATYPELTPYKPHPNSWLMTRDRYEITGGYDERFAGWYGTDADFRDRCRLAGKIEILAEDLWRVPREAIADASTTTYQRKTQADDENIRRIKGERRGLKDQRPLRGRFPWIKVA